MHTLRTRFPLILLGLLALLSGVSPPVLRAWRYDGRTLVAVSPGEAYAAQTVSDPKTPQATLPPTADLDGDGLAERLALQGGRMAIYPAEDGEPAWQSPESWQVRQALVTDLDADGQLELALLVWRPFAPWPVDSFLPHGGYIAEHHDRRGRSCHVVLIHWKGDEYRELWAGSALARPLRSLLAADLDGDGRQELAALEGRYTDPLFLPARSLAIWAWNGFGFDLQARLEGRFHRITVVPAGEAETILLGD